MKDYDPNPEDKELNELVCVTVYFIIYILLLYSHIYFRINNFRGNLCFRILWDII